MGLRENIDWGEKAVSEVKKYVAYSSANQRLDRLAAQLRVYENARKATAAQREALKEAQEEAQKTALMVSSVMARAAYFEKVDEVAAASKLAPPPLPVVKMPSVMQINTPVSDALRAVRGVKDQTGAVLEPSLTNTAFDWWVQNGHPQDTHTFIMAMAWAAKQEQVGNCGELAAIAFIYLEDQGVRPIDYMTFSAAGYDHAWVVIGRANGSDPQKLRTWGPDAVFCDPWQLREGRVYSADDLIKKKTTNLDAAYKLDSADLVDAGLPIVNWRTA